MRVLTNVSKSIIVAVLSCSLLTVWYTSNLEFTDLGFTNASSSDSLNLSDNSLISDYQDFASASDESLWSVMGSELNLDHKDQTAAVQSAIRGLLADQGKLYSILQSAGPYIYFILNQTQSRGLPAELALIPVIESEFNPNDHSNKGATGLWQLMPETAHELGIKIKSGYDGRRNVVDSTKAALAYFNDLGNEFKGNWYLAIAAYNCGQVKVEHAEKRTGSDSFWNLPLPTETKYYVPKLLAVAAIIKNPEKYGVTLPPISNQPYFTEVTTNKPVNLNKVAANSGISVATLNTLNPDYNHHIVLPKKDGYDLLVPLKKAPVVKVAIANAIAPPSARARVHSKIA